MTRVGWATLALALVAALLLCLEWAPGCEDDGIEMVDSAEGIEVVR